jgi:hypothetical protein
MRPRQRHGAQSSGEPLTPLLPAEHTSFETNGERLDTIAGENMALKIGAGTALLGAAIVAIVLATAGSAGTTRPVPAPIPVSVLINPNHPGVPVPPAFLGLSFELSSAAQIARYADSGNLATLLRSLGPGVLRFGGASADTRVAWTDAQILRPPWASSVLTPNDLRDLARLARATHWHVLLTIGLVHYDPDAAAREVAAAKAALGPWLTGIEVGNEPDSYAVHGLRRSPWDEAKYNAEVSGYRNAIAATTPGIQVAGPGVSGSSAFKHWGPAVVLAQRPALLTGHHYPLGCRSRYSSTIPRLLSQYTRGLEARSLRRYMSLSRASGIPLRIDETNTVSCGGKAGVSNTFAAALWAVSYIAQTMSAGAAGINFEGNHARCDGYSPVCAPTPARLLDGALQPQPEWYALLLTRGLIGNRPVHTTILPRRRPNITVTALRGPHGALRFVLVDDDPPGSRAVALSLHVGGGYTGATVLRLTAPSPQSVFGVRLGGRTVAADGSWPQPSHLPQLAVRSGVVALQMAPSSAALVTVAPARGHHGGGRDARDGRVHGRGPAQRSTRPTRSCPRTACASGQPLRVAGRRPRAPKRG